MRIRQTIDKQSECLSRHSRSSVVCVLVAVVLAGSMATATAADTNVSTKAARNLMISEISIMQWLGSEGNWIELYNPFDSPVDASGCLLHGEGRDLYRFPDRSAIPPYAFVLIRFTAKKDLRMTRQSERVDSTKLSFLDNTAEVILQPVVEETNWPEIVESRCESAEQEKRDAMVARIKADLARYGAFLRLKVGYCALYEKGSVRKENLVDYVLWGEEVSLGTHPMAKRFAEYAAWAEKRGFYNREQHVWARERRLWGADGARPPISAQFLVDFSCNDYSTMTICAFDFNAGRPIGWTLRLEGTPGRATMPMPSDFRISYEDERPDVANLVDICVQFWEEWKEWGRLRRAAKECPIHRRIQVAKDPFFRQMLFDKDIGDTEPIFFSDMGAVEPGGYYLRVRFESGIYSSNWSDYRYVAVSQRLKGRTPKPVDTKSDQRGGDAPGRDGTHADMERNEEAK